MRNESAGYCIECGSKLTAKGVCPLCGYERPIPKKTRFAAALIAVCLSLSALMLAGIIAFKSPRVQAYIYRFEIQLGISDKLDYFGGIIEFYPYVSKGVATERILNADLPYETRKGGEWYEIQDYILSYDGYQKAHKITGTDDGLWAYPTNDGMKIKYNVHYIQVEGEIPGIDELNRELECNSFWLANTFLSYTEPDRYYRLLEDGGESGYTVESITAVTYNNKRFLSAVSTACFAKSDDYFDGEYHLYSGIYDLYTGRKVSSKRLITFDEDFVELFKESFKDDAENYAILNEMGDEYLKSLFLEDQPLRGEPQIFIMPAGIGVAVNYSYTAENNMRYNGYLYQIFSVNRIDSAKWIYDYE